MGHPIVRRWLTRALNHITSAVSRHHGSAQAKGKGRLGTARKGAVHLCASACPHYVCFITSSSLLSLLSFFLLLQFHIFTPSRPTSLANIRTHILPISLSLSHSKQTTSSAHNPPLETKKKPSLVLIPNRRYACPVHSSHHNLLHISPLLANYKSIRARRQQ